MTLMHLRIWVYLFIILKIIIILEFIIDLEILILEIRYKEIYEELAKIDNYDMKEKIYKEKKIGFILIDEKINFNKKVIIEIIKKD